MREECNVVPSYNLSWTAIRERQVGSTSQQSYQWGAGSTWEIQWGD